MPTTIDCPDAELTTELVLYDGACGLCHRSVRWILDREADTRLRFAPLQGSTTSGLRDAGLAIPDSLGSVVFIHAGQVFVRARAVARVAPYLRWPWRALGVMRFLPWLPDLGYRLVARFRLRWFGTADLCLLPDPAKASRFLP